MDFKAGSYSKHCIFWTKAKITEYDYVADCVLHYKK